MASNSNTGKLGEELAINYLKKLGYIILECNYRTRFGEIDIIVKKGDKVSFVEVKTRQSIEKGMPYESITPRKIQHLMHAAQFYLLQKNWRNCKLSLDAVSIVLEKGIVKDIRFFQNIAS